MKENSKIASNTGLELKSSTMAMFIQEITNTEILQDMVHLRFTSAKVV